MHIAYIVDHRTVISSRHVYASALYRDQYRQRCMIEQLNASLSGHRILLHVIDAI